MSDEYERERQTQGGMEGGREREIERERERKRERERERERERDAREISVCVCARAPEREVANMHCGKGVGIEWRRPMGYPVFSAGFCLQKSLMRAYAHHRRAPVGYHRCIYIYVRIHIHICIHIYTCIIYTVIYIGGYHRCNTVQGGEVPKDTLSCRSFSAKEPLIVGLFCGK